MSDIVKIKSRIKEAIKQSGLSQDKFAKMLSVSQSCVAHYVKGDILPSIDKFADICKILEVDASYLLGLED